MGWNLVNWDQFNCPKLASRLGIPTFRLANTSFLGKLVQCMVDKKETLWVQVLTHKYLSHSSFMSVKVGQGVSHMQCGILKAKDKFLAGFKFCLGAGNTSLQYDEWSSFGPFYYEVPFVAIHDANIYLRDIIVEGCWCVNHLYILLPMNFPSRLDSMECILAHGFQDRWIWAYSSSGSLQQQ